jgi:hypothetical protein
MNSFITFPDPDILIGNYHRLCELLDLNLINLKNISYLVMDDFYRNRSARLSDEIKRVVNETRVSRRFFWLLSLSFDFPRNNPIGYAELRTLIISFKINKFFSIVWTMELRKNIGVKQKKNLNSK